ncbi:MAG TPA: 2,3-epoxybenzoyl-CoA dihydrolase [Myxococcales bacterium]|nr:2,3-epoxybenzoyl-CoA dihydrolase [Myxococcales bacterium]
MAQGPEPREPVEFETHPARYRHWKLAFEGPVARLSMAVKEDGGLRPGYQLKLNSYDLGVDIELADAVQRIRFEHPEVGAVILDSALPRLFCAGANIFMLASSSHPFKVNFCKFTNETRLAIEDASAHSGIKWIAALNGTASGGGYELALAADEILLVDDGSSAVSLPEVALLAVLPGTGGLTRVVDKRKVRRDLADVFSALPEGVKGKRAVDWRLVDQVIPKSRFDQAVAERARELAAKTDRKAAVPGVTLEPLQPEVTPTRRQYRCVTLDLDHGRRLATLTVKAPVGREPPIWHLRAFRELDDALLQLRVNQPEIGTVLLKTTGNPEDVLAYDQFLATLSTQSWLGREILGQVRRTLKRLDLTAKTFYAIIEPDSCFAGCLAEIALAADRTYMLDKPGSQIRFGPLSAGLLPMSNGLSRLATRFLSDPTQVTRALEHASPFSAKEALEAGLVTFAPDALDWDDELRLAIEERAAISPDALTGMEANLRFAGPETMETKIFGRLSAWQNWIFQRPNAVGEKGALSLYGQKGQRPEFDWRRT